VKLHLKKKEKISKKEDEDEDGQVGPMILAIEGHK
jgi:hypothetical protein